MSEDNTLDTKILKGIPVSNYIKSNLSNDIKKLAQHGVIPGLAVVLVGDDPASKVYVRNKQDVFKKYNCFSKTYKLPNETTETELLELISSLNADSNFHGVLVQLPLPNQIDNQKILCKISPDKDVDGFHPMNLGNLLAGRPSYIPCTPNGVIQILDYYNIKVSGRHAVIIGRSNIVGKPMFALLAQKFDVGNATVTICHTGTKDLKKITKQADIIIAAVGIPNLINDDMISKGVDIIDVGINRINDKSTRGFSLVGDVDYNSVLGKANSITPVPGGVGPMTISMLLSNTVKSAMKSMHI